MSTDTPLDLVFFEILVKYRDTSQVSELVLRIHGNSHALLSGLALSKVVQARNVLQAYFTLKLTFFNILRSN